ncbi:hypothetical protein [Bradymonas sediminis]|uniref:Uncharacterized protein n=1 Tax=Bradymonas sediminis TaxID=1548548 RepID=A0A2Z4FHG0_9DELT|nr:hypothetical protein [Bradymonas sediminis]AWV88330.1 hypothetical protein DN745_02820 [Bradymonas sediminis]TDP77455.1 hypothetical protein DFR33_101357 [Bradymonas sediminis]
MRHLKNLLIAVIPMLLVSSLMLMGCEKKAEETAIESGTYAGTVKKVVPEKKEIYVDSEGREFELYFTETTTLTLNDEPAKFDALKTGQKVEVEVKKVGQRLDPISVKIQE